jgi:hypothetical protein
MITAPVMLPVNPVATAVPDTELEIKCKKGKT